MRVIKFRKWDNEEKVMIDGDSLAFEEYLPIKNHLSQAGIMQFTGFLDCKGIEIYEGDIIQFYNERCYHKKYPETQLRLWRSDVVFLGGAFLISEDDNGDYETDLYSFSNDFGNSADKAHLQVVGNIYENPSLLKTRFLNIKRKGE